jgi:hypothetical protein
VKKLLALGLILLLPFQSVSANEIIPEIPYEISTISDLESIESLVNFLVIDNETIGASGRSWMQPNGFPIFRAYNKYSKSTIKCNIYNCNWN